MIKVFTDRLNREDRGFTLIELMVVVLIIAILIAIAIPTFLGARRRAQDRGAQSNLRNAVTAAKVIFSDREDYRCIYLPQNPPVCDGDDTDMSPLEDSEPSLEFVAADVDGDVTGRISVEAIGATIFVAATYSPSGLCWIVMDRTGTAGDPNLGTSWTVEANDADGVGCNAEAQPGEDEPDVWFSQPADAADALL